MAGGAIVRAIRAENVLMRRHLVRVGQQANHERLDRRGVGHSLREFLIYYALRWNDEGLAFVSKSIQDLHSGWTPPLESLLSFQGLIAGVNLGPILTVDGSMLNVPSVDRLVKLLCNEGLISHVTSSNHQQAAVLKRMVVRERTTGVAWGDCGISRDPSFVGEQVGDGSEGDRAVNSQRAARHQHPFACDG